jgi:hypothetical protein
LLWLIGIAESPNTIVVKAPASGRNYQKPAFLGELFAGDRLHPECRAIGSYFNLARHQSEAVSQWLRYDQAACLIYGCSHTIRLPNMWLYGVC